MDLSGFQSVESIGKISECFQADFERVLMWFGTWFQTGFQLFWLGLGLDLHHF